MTSIVDVADMYRAATGRDPFTAPWEAVARVSYGLDLRPEDVAHLQATTRRTADGLGGLSGTGKPMREGWFRVGRRGRKSFEAAFFADYEAIYGAHERYLVPGERGLIAIISKDLAGSTAVARFCELHAEALGIACKWTSMGAVRILELEGVPFGIACFPCSSKAPRGYAIPVVICDEIAHWQTDADEYSNADTEVLAAIRPAQAQFPDSRLIAISSPLGCDGIFHATVEGALGDDAPDGVFAAEGPTWQWNPDITETRTRELEKDPETHAREFGAVPSTSEGTAFDVADVAHCFEPHPGVYESGKPFLVIDSAQSANTFACLICSWGDPTKERVEKKHRNADGTIVPVLCPVTGYIMREPAADRPVLRVTTVFGWTGAEVRELGMARVMESLAAEAKSVDAEFIFADQYGAPFIQAYLSKLGVQLRWFYTPRTAKHESVILLRALMRDKQIEIADHARMREDLRTFPRRVSGGGFVYGGDARRTHHWDYASALLVLGIAHNAGGTDAAGEHYRIDRSPVRKRGSAPQAGPRNWGVDPRYGEI